MVLNMLLVYQYCVKVGLLVFSVVMVLFMMILQDFCDALEFESMFGLSINLPYHFSFSLFLFPFQIVQL